MGIQDIISGENRFMDFWFDPNGIAGRGGASRLVTLETQGLSRVDTLNLQDLLAEMGVDLEQCSDNELQTWLKFLEDDSVAALRWDNGQLRLKASSTQDIQRYASTDALDLISNLSTDPSEDNLNRLLAVYNPVDDMMFDVAEIDRSPFSRTVSRVSNGLYGAAKIGPENKTNTALMATTLDSSTLEGRLANLGLGNANYQAFGQNDFQTRDDSNGNGGLWLTGFHQELAVMDKDRVGVTFQHGVGDSKRTGMGWGGAEIKAKKVLGASGVLTHTGHLETTGTKNLGGSFFLFNEGNVSGQRGFEVDLEHNLNGGNQLTFGLWNKHKSVGGTKVQDIEIDRPKGAKSYDSILDMSKTGQITLHIKWDTQDTWSEHTIRHSSITAENVAGLRAMSNIEQFSFGGGRGLLADKDKTDIESFTFNNMRFYSR